ncbi:MAG: hypothetical protein C4320_09770, partial [Armatimonadota bacterium]
ELEALVLCGALDGLHPNRRAMLSALRSAQEYARCAAGGAGVLPLDYPEPALDLTLPDFNERERAVHERTFLGMDVARHLVAFERDRLAARGAVTTAEARR